MKRFTSETQKTGELGEKIACQYLQKHRFLILDRNFSSRMGEVDIIAQKENVLHFIEVKTSVSREMREGKVRVSYETISPEENFHKYKARKFVKTVEYYLLTRNVSHETDISIDLVAVRLDKDKRIAKVKMYPNVV